MARLETNVKTDVSTSERAAHSYWLDRCLGSLDSIRVGLTGEKDEHGVINDHAPALDANRLKVLSEMLAEVDLKTWRESEW